MLVLVCLEVQLYGILLKLRKNSIENCSQRFFLILEGAIGHLVEYYTTNHDFKSSFEEVESF